MMDEKNALSIFAEIQTADQKINSNNDLFFDGKISDDFLLPIIESYVRYYATGESHTAKAKRSDLKYFLEYLSTNLISVDKVLVLDWTLQKTKNFVEFRLKIGESPSTVSRRLATIKHLGRTLSERIPGFINPAREVKAPVFQTARPQGLSKEEIIALEVHINRVLSDPAVKFQDYRNSLIIKLFLATGLRADEIRNLIRGQLSDNLEWLSHVKTKGKRFRDVYIPEEVRPYLEHYLILSKQEVILKHAGASQFNKKEWTTLPLFISTHRASILNLNSFCLAPKTLWTIISKMGKDVNLISSMEITHIHPHKLRHTFAHGLLDTSNDVRLVAQALGHGDVRTTMRYTERTHEELATAIEKKHRKS